MLLVGTCGFKSEAILLVFDKKIKEVVHMWKLLSSLLLTSVIALTLTAGLSFAKGPKPKPGKVEVCHVPPGNPFNAHMIVIAGYAFESHMTHGDTEGPCPEP